MRPVNLIPVEDRHGDNAPLRTGPLVYILLGALVLVLAGVSMLILTSNQISDSKSELAQVKQEDAAAQARAESLASYSQFSALHAERVQTISSLAESRFDWERVMRELSLILPHDVWLTSLDASASSESEGSSSGSSGGSSGGGSLGGSISGPSLTISGCANGHDGVAGFVTALKDIDGVTRVGLESSELADEEEGAGSVSGSSSGSGSGGGSGGGSDCRTRSFVSPTEKSEASASEVSGESSSEGSEGG
jgi:Tfp pilus assembly protein PilN